MISHLSGNENSKFFIIEKKLKNILLQSDMFVTHLCHI